MTAEETQQSARILLIDSHPITLLGLNALLEACSDYEVVDKLSSASGITEILKQKRPDLVLMDLHLPKTNGINLIREINAATENSAKIVILTSALSQAETCDLIRTGVKGILLKEMATALIMQCLRRVQSGGEWIERNSMKHAFEQMLRRESEHQSIAAQLSPREMNLATLIASGHNNKSAARQLLITEGSARVYLNRIYTKLQVPNRLQLAILFKEKGLV